MTRKISTCNHMFYLKNSYSCNSRMWKFIPDSCCPVIVYFTLFFCFFSNQIIHLNLLFHLLRIIALVYPLRAFWQKFCQREKQNLITKKMCPTVRMQSISVHVLTSIYTSYLGRLLVKSTAFTASNCRVTFPSQRLFFLPLRKLFSIRCHIGELILHNS